MDLSNVSTADLQALKAGDLSKVSTEGLHAIRQEQIAPAPQPGVEMRATPPGPSGLEHLEDVAGTVAHHPLTTGVGMGENALNAVTAPVQRTWERMRGEPITGDEGYQPRTEAGKEIAQESGAEGAAASGAFDKLAGTGPYAQSFKEAAGKASDLAATAGVVAPAAELAGRVPGAMSAAGEAVNAPKAASIPPAVQRQVQRGIEISPSSVQEAQPSTRAAVPGQLTETDIESPGAQRERILKNAATNNAHISQGLGVNATDHITPTDIDEARGIGPDGKVQTTRVDPRTGEAKETDLSVYNRMGNAANGQPVGAGTAGRIGDAATHTEASSDAALSTITRMTKTYQERYAPGAPIDGGQIQGDISTLRQRARKGLASDNLDQQDIGMAARKIADSLEDEMASHAPENSQLAGDFRQARQHLAQLNDAETALKGGSYDPQVLSRLRAKGGTLSGPLADVADSAEIAPKDVMHPQKAPAPPGARYSLSGIAEKGGELFAGGLNKLTGGTNNAAEAIARHVPPPGEPEGKIGALTPPPGRAGAAQVEGQGNMSLPPGVAPPPPLELMPGSLPEAGHAHQYGLHLPPGHGAAAHARMGEIFRRAQQGAGTETYPVEGQ
jgi:hypothetical protein